MTNQIIHQTYSSRSIHQSNPISKKLLNLMEEKQTNLCVSLDVINKSNFLRIANLIGPHICILKTHIDIIVDFDQDLIHQLVKLSQEHNFLIFEDRKFADIGNTVKLQYSSGIYKIADWSHITNAHSVPGEGIITGLSEIGIPKGRGLLLLAEMSSKGNLAKDQYTIETLKMAQRHPEFVIGFISQNRLESNEKEDWIVMSPGVGLDSVGDSLGQSYRTPYEVVCESGSDVMIVGRGIYKNLDDDQEILKQALRYKEAGWQAYLQRIKKT
ncbi:humps family-domain-containing protein [Melampsora americana]|nr:humps family-domain-containing protein [Melampsora americana]